MTWAYKLLNGMQQYDISISLFSSVSNSPLVTCRYYLFILSMNDWSITVKYRLLIKISAVVYFLKCGSLFLIIFSYF